MIWKKFIINNLKNMLNKMLKKIKIMKINYHNGNILQNKIYN